MQHGKARGGIARAAVSAALTGVLAFGGAMAPLSVALAEEVTISFKDSKGAPVVTDDVKYDKYVKVFSATSIDNDKNTKPDSDPEESVDYANLDWAGGTAEGVSWTDAKTAVITFLETTGGADTSEDWVTQSYVQFLAERGLATGTDSTDYNSASNAALYIGQQIAAANKVAPSYKTDTYNPNVPHIPNADTFAGKLAQALQSATSPALTQAFSGTLSEVGYYLLLDTDGETNANPIWLPFDGEDVTLYEKTDVPTLQKEGKEPGEGNKKVIDAGTGETVTFTLTGVLPKGENYAAGKVQFEDTLPNGLTLDADSIKVMQGTSEVTGKFNPIVNGQTFTLTSTAAFDATTDAITLVVTYNTTVNENQGTGADNMSTNTATFKYGDNEATTESEASVISYAIKLFKNDGDTTYLQGAKFTIQDESGKYVQEDGKLGPQAYEFTTDANGVITAAALDSGTYLITETEPPVGFEAVDPFYLKVEPTYEQVSQELKELKGVIVNESDDEVTDNEKVSVTAADTKTGTVELTVSDNEEEIRLPITGMTPSQLGTVAGVVLVAAGAAMVLRRRQAEQA